MKITSYWQTETGRFSSSQGFINRKLSPITEKELFLEIKPFGQDNKLVVQFIGGPTGYESYYLNQFIDLIEGAPKHLNLSICAGTINSWPHCWVKYSDLKRLLPQLKEAQTPWTNKHITESTSSDGKTSFTAWDESGANIIGEFSTHEKAKEALIEYAKTLN